jgi:DNA polymerase III epsilon subunit-like protein
MNYIVLDTETGGLATETHSLLSVAFIKTTSRYQELKDIHLKIRHPEFCVTPRAMEINKIDLRESAAWIDPMEARLALLDFLGVDKDIGSKTGIYPTYTAVGANINFDIGFLKKFFGEPTWNNIFYHRSEDVMTVFRELQKTGIIPAPKGYALEQLLNALGIKSDPDCLHDALYDARQALAAAREMQRRGDVLGDALKQYVKRYGGDLNAILKCYRGAGTQAKLKKLRQS